MRWGTRSIAKRDIVEVKLKPVPSRSWRAREEVQMRSADALLNVKAASLSHDEMNWLAQALQALAATI